MSAVGRREGLLLGILELRAALREERLLLLLQFLFCEAGHLEFGHFALAILAGRVSL